MPSLSQRLFDDADDGAIDPFALFEEWFADARASEPSDPHAMTIATVDSLGLPDARMVLLNAHDRRGFVFFTNFESAKGRQLSARPEAAMVFHWKSLLRQVRGRGPVEIVAPEEADAYFASRPRGSQIASSASEQSRPLADRATLEARTAVLEAKYAGADVPRPPHWSGFRLVPLVLEFWQQGPFRMHDRVQFRRDGAVAPWRRQRLYP